MDINVTEIVEAHLLDDLEALGVKLDKWNTEFNWSDTIEEGGGTEFQGTYIDSMSDLFVRKRNGELIGSGWMDCITDSVGCLYCFWVQFSAGGKVLVQDFGIPDRIWARLSEGDKTYLAATHQGWEGDARMKPYRIRVVSDLIRNYLSDLKIEITSLHEQRLPQIFDEALYRSESAKIIDLAEQILNGKTLDSVVSTETYRFSTHSDDPRLGAIIEKLVKLEYEVRHATIAFA